MAHLWTIQGFGYVRARLTRLGPFEYTLQISRERGANENSATGTIKGDFRELSEAASVKSHAIESVDGNVMKIVFTDITENEARFRVMGQVPGATSGPGLEK